MKLSTLVAAVAEPCDLSVKFGSSSLNIVYDKSRYTRRTEERMLECMKDNSPVKMLAQFVEALVIKWDLVSDEGVPIKPTDEDITAFDVPVPILQEVVTAIHEDNHPNQKNSASTNVD